jgi:hypothetical protein
MQTPKNPVFLQGSDQKLVAGPASGGSVVPGSRFLIFPAPTPVGKLPVTADEFHQLVGLVNGLIYRIAADFLEILFFRIAPDSTWILLDPPGSTWLSG